MSPIKPERGFLDPVYGGPQLQDRGGEHPTHQNGDNHEDEDVQLVGISCIHRCDIKAHVKLLESSCNN